MLSALTRKQADAAEISASFGSDGVWLGSARTLQRVGAHDQAQPGARVDPEQLRAALWESRDAKRASTKTELVFSPPPAVEAARHGASPARQAQIDHALMRAANEALERCTLQADVVRRLNGPPEKAVGVAAAAVLRVTEQAERDVAPRVSVHVVIVGVERADGKVVGPDAATMESALASADAAALRVLEQELEGPERATPAPVTAVPAVEPEADPAPRREDARPAAVAANDRVAARDAAAQLWANSADPLSAYGVLPDPRLQAEIGLGALKRAPELAGMTTADLWRLSADLHATLGSSGPTLTAAGASPSQPSAALTRDLVRGWWREHGDDAARVVAGRGTGVLERYSRLLGPAATEALTRRAQEIRARGVRGPGPAGDRDPFSALDKAVALWAQGPKTAAALETQVAADRELLFRARFNLAKRAVAAGEAERGTPVVRDPGQVREDLQAICTSLGEARSEPILALARARHEQLKHVETDVLVELLYGSPNPVDSFDVQAAGERRALEDRWLTLIKEREQLAKDGKAVKAKNDAAPELKELRERWDATSDELRALQQANAGQWASGKHPTQWLAGNGHAQANRASASAVVEARLARENASEVDARVESGQAELAVPPELSQVAPSDLVGAGIDGGM